jgi:hypothetical protein
MFKRSFNTKDGRVTKPLKATKNAYPEHLKRKMQDSLDNQSVGR